MLISCSKAEKDYKDGFPQTLFPKSVASNCTKSEFCSFSTSSKTRKLIFVCVFFSKNTKEGGVLIFYLYRILGVVVCH